jgi:hypothetical protein
LTGVVLAGLLLPGWQAEAYTVTAASSDNRLYVAVYQRDVNLPLENIFIAATPPSHVSSPITIYAPDVVPPGSGRIAGLSFAVSPSAPPGSLGNLTLTIQGTVGGSPVVVNTYIPLEVSTVAPRVQGVIGDPGGIPGLAEQDTDGDGTPDLEEIAFGDDPFVSSLAAIPALTPAGLAILILLVLLTCVLAVRRS